MKILISSDIEGIAGLDDYSQFRQSKKEEYLESCNVLTEEVNVAVEACIEAGANKILVVDGHSRGKNIIRDKLNSKATLIEKKGLRMIEGIDQGMDLCIFLGYHGRSLLPNSFTAHTYSSKVISKLKVNKKEVSEGELNALVAKYLGVKVVFISGTDHAIKELHIEGLRSVVTKKSIKWDKAKSSNKEKIHKEIKKKIKEAIEDSKNIGFIDLPVENLEFEVTFNNYFVLEEINEEKINQKTIKFNAKNVLEGYLKCMKLMNLAMKKYNKVYNN